MKAIAIILSIALAGPAADTSVPTPPSAPSEADQLRGKELFDNGYKLFQEGSYAEAIQAFRLAYATSGDPTLLYNIALAAERAGEYDLALEYLQAYRVHAPADEWDKLAEKAESFRKRKLNAQLEAQRSGGAPVQPAAEPTAAPAKPVLLDEPAPRERKIFGPAAAVFTSVAAASFATALGLGLAARGRDKAAADRCRDGDAGRLCSDDADADLSASRKFALGTDIMIGIGSAAALALVIVLATNAARKKKDARRRNTALAPAGLGFRF